MTGSAHRERTTAPSRTISPLAEALRDALLALADHSDPSVGLAIELAQTALEQGDACLDLARWADQSVDGLRCPPLAVWRQALLDSGLAADNTDHRPLVLAGSRLYLARYWRYERDIAADLARRAAAVPGHGDPARLTAILDGLFGPAATETAQQRAAAELALTQRLSIIAGGPGTGKTTTVVKILAALQLCAATPLRIRLAAPTGKAAARLQTAVRDALAALHLPPAVRDSIPTAASTVHQLLGARRHDHRFRHHRDAPLILDALVLDEASMVDVALLAKLLAALSSDARLILLGDQDQLPAVEPGAVFGALCDGLTEPPPGTGAVVRLTHSFRHRDNVGLQTLAARVRQGRNVDDLALTQPPAGVEWLESADRRTLLQRLLDGYADFLNASATALRAEELLGTGCGFQALAALRQGSRGVAELNPAFELFLERHGIKRPRAAWYPGRLIMITVNDYELGLYNGDIGIALTTPKGLRVGFWNPAAGPRWLPPQHLPPHETAFVMSIHKSQGSEFDTTLVILPDAPGPYLSRALLYTGVTRARRGVTLVGSRSVLDACVRNGSSTQSALAERLRDARRAVAEPGTR